MTGLTFYLTFLRPSFSVRHGPFGNGYERSCMRLFGMVPSAIGMKGHACGLLARFLLLLGTGHSYHQPCLSVYPMGASRYDDIREGHSVKEHVISSNM
uniref:Uncharacterized protein n=1 Tax=Tanacetum cinerariifolium TaxID=118510 RepID=A0A699KFG2_TANCI|nr:hypothetical protein [Tanacetum cinerariifolium]